MKRSIPLLTLLVLSITITTTTSYAQSDDGGPPSPQVVTTTVTNVTPPTTAVPSTPAVVTTTVQAPTNDWHQLLSDLLVAVASAVFLIITGTLLPKLRTWLASKAASEDAGVATKLLLGATIKVEQFIEAGLIQVWDVFKADYAAARLPESPGGTTVTAEELAAAKDHVLAAVKEYLGQNGLKELTSLLGFGGSQLDSWLKAKIEVKVQAATQMGSVAAASVTSPQSAAAILSAL